MPVTRLLAAAPIDPGTLAIVYCNRHGYFIRTIDISGAMRADDGPVVVLFREYYTFNITHTEISGSIPNKDAMVTFYDGERIVARYGYLAPESKNPWIRVGPSTNAAIVGWESGELTAGLVSDEGGFMPSLPADPQPPTPPARITVATAGRWVLQLSREQPSMVVYNSDDPGHSATIPAKLVPFERMWQALKTEQKDTGIQMRQTWMVQQIRNNVPADPKGIEQVLTELVTLSGDAKLAAILKKRPIFPTTVPSVWPESPKPRDPAKGPWGPLP